MRRSLVTLVGLASAWCLCAWPGVAANPVIGVVTSAHPFSVGSVETKPEAGPVAVVDGDQVSSATSPVMFRLNGENRAVLAEKSIARVRSAKEDGSYFYLSRGSIQYDARKEPLAICARDRLYVPSTPGSGEVVIQDNKVQVKLTTGTMLRHGTEPCTEKALPLWLTAPVSSSAIAGGAGAAATASATTAATASATAAATATATAAGAGLGIGIPAAATIGIATATAGGVVAATLASQSPASASPTTPGQ